VKVLRVNANSSHQRCGGEGSTAVRILLVTSRIHSTNQRGAECGAYVREGRVHRASECCTSTNLSNQQWRECARAEGGRGPPRCGTSLHFHQLEAIKRCAECVRVHAEEGPTAHACDRLRGARPQPRVRVREQSVGVATHRISLVGGVNQENGGESLSDGYSHAASESERAWGMIM
jgi:hypothetical protein